MPALTLIEALADQRAQALADAAALQQIVDRYGNDDPANGFNAGHPANLRAAAEWLHSLADVYRRSIDNLERPS